MFLVLMLTKHCGEFIVQIDNGVNLEHLILICDLFLDDVNESRNSRIFKLIMMTFVVTLMNLKI